MHHLFTSVCSPCCPAFSLQLKLFVFFFCLDRLFELRVEEKDVLMEALQEPWQVQERTMETDISALQWVEDLEQRVIAADLHLKVSEHLIFSVSLLYII